MIQMGAVNINSCIVMHSLPGRLRLKIDTHLSAAKIEAYYRSLSGVYSASYNSISKSLLIYYDERQISFQSFCGVKRKKTLNQDEENVSVSKRWRLIKLCGAIFSIHWLINKTGYLFVYKALIDRLIAGFALLLFLPTIKEAWAAIKNRNLLSADLLTVCSLFACIYLGQPASALIIYMMSNISELLTDLTSMKTKSHLQSLLKLETPYAWRVSEDEKVSKVAVDELKTNDIIKVHKGERIPADGLLVKGHTLIDESAITGESSLKEKTNGSIVYAGSICMDSELLISVTKTGRETALGRMISLIEDAYNSKSPRQVYADQMAKKLVGLSYAMTIFTFLFTKNMNKALGMLVIDFVCGIKLSTSAAFSATIGKAAKQGILIKDSSYIEELAQIDTVVFDKTGTITEGRPYITQMKGYNGYSVKEVLYKAAILEQTSSHPLAYAFLEEAKKQQLSLPEISVHNQVEVQTGKGIFGEVDGSLVHVGSLRFLQDEEIMIDSLALSDHTHSVFVAIDGKLAGAITIQDRIRDGMGIAIKSLRALGIKKTLMLTGDEYGNAAAVARRVKLDKVYAKLLPEDKVRILRKESVKGKVAMVGDGMNDAPALAHANVGITFGGKRTDLAVEASDIVIVKDNPILLPEMVQLSKGTLRTIKQNVYITIILNGSAILLTVFGLLTPVAGAALHNLATIGVVSNSMKILMKGEGRNDKLVYHSSRYTWKDSTTGAGIAEPLLV